MDPDSEEDEEEIIERRRREREAMLARLQQQQNPEQDDSQPHTPMSSKSRSSSPDSEAVGQDAAEDFENDSEFDFLESVKSKRRTTTEEDESKTEDDDKPKKPFANGLDMFSEDMFTEDYSNVNISILLLCFLCFHFRQLTKSFSAQHIIISWVWPNVVFLFTRMPDN